MDRIYDALEEIRLRPDMYLSAESMTCLYQFVTGYQLALLDAGIEKYGQLYPLPFYQFFTHYCITKYHDRRSMGDYANILLKQCGNKEKDAMWYFFEVLDEYKENAKIVSCEICELNEENISFYLTKYYQNHYDMIKRFFPEDNNRTFYPVYYKDVQKLYHISFSFDIDILLPVSEDEAVRGSLLYRFEKEGSFMETLEQHMKRRFGSVTWQEVRFSDEQMLSLLNDYIFKGKTREI